jgi:hypothetical protein
VDWGPSAASDFHGNAWRATARSAPWQRLAEHFGLRVTDLPELFTRRFNVAPTLRICRSIGRGPMGNPLPT